MVESRKPVVGPRSEPLDPAARHWRPSLYGLLEDRDGHRSCCLLSPEVIESDLLKCVMESLRLEQDKLDKKGNLSKTIEDVQKTIDLLVAAREAIAAGMSDSIFTVHAHGF